MASGVLIETVFLELVLSSAGLDAAQGQDVLRPWF